MYETSQTQLSLGVLIELNDALHVYTDDFVLVGGWAPYFITRGRFDHCGSMDIDLMLRPTILRRYESIREIIEALGFVIVPERLFRFRRELPRKAAPVVELDLLSEPEAVEMLPRGLIPVQEELAAAMIPGCGIALAHYFAAQAEGTLPDGSRGSSVIRTANIVAMLGMKGHALGRPRKMDKDCYDIFAMCGFAAQSPSASARAFLAAWQRSRREERHGQFVRDALARVGRFFDARDARGPLAVARFFGADGVRETEAFLAVSEFLRGVQGL